MFTALGVAGHVARLQNLAHDSDEPLLFGIVAIGFIASALYSIADSRYHKL